MTFNLRIITPNVTGLVEDVESLTLSTLAGQITVLPNHFPLVSGVNITKVKIMKNKQPIYGFASDGVISVKEHETVLILNAFEFKDNIDIDRAKASFTRAQERLNNKDGSLDVKRAEAAMQRALTRIELFEGK